MPDYIRLNQSWGLMQTARSNTAIVGVRALICECGDGALSMINTQIFDAILIAINNLPQSADTGCNFRGHRQYSQLLRCRSVIICLGLSLSLVVETRPSNFTRQLHPRLSRHCFRRRMSLGSTRPTTHQQ